MKRRNAPLFLLLFCPLAWAACSAERSASSADMAEAAASGEDLGYSTDAATTTAAPAEPAVRAPMPNAQQTAPDTTSGAAPAQPGAGAPIIAQAMIIRTGEARVRVDSLELATERVRRLAQQLGGYVGNTSIETGDESNREARLEVKLPSANFDRAVSGLNPLGDVERVTSSAEDVSEEFVDVTARVANARQMEQRLLELLANRTGNLEQVLTVERELARVRQEIERYEGRLRFLRTRAAVSTLTVILFEGRSVVGNDPGENPILDAIGMAWDNFIAFVAGFISLLGVLIPLGLLAWLAWWIFRKVRGSRPPRAPRPPQPPEAGAGPV